MKRPGLERVVDECRVLVDGAVSVAVADVVEVVRDAILVRRRDEVRRGLLHASEEALKRRVRILRRVVEYRVDYVTVPAGSRPLRRRAALLRWLN